MYRSTNRPTHIMTPLCQYRDALGKPREGVHRYRILDVAVVDVVLTLLVAWAVSVGTQWPFWACALGLFLVGIVAHRAFCVHTKVDQFLEKLWLTVVPP